VDNPIGLERLNKHLCAGLGGLNLVLLAGASYNELFIETYMSFRRRESCESTLTNPMGLGCCTLGLLWFCVVHSKPIGLHFGV
jgi:hypothetical protein